MSKNIKIPKEIILAQKLIWLTVAAFFIITYSELSEASILDNYSFLVQLLTVLIFCGCAKLIINLLGSGNNLARIAILLLTINAIYFSLSDLEHGSFKEIPITILHVYISYLLYSKPGSNHFN